jgi:hypothetical protein
MKNQVWTIKGRWEPTHQNQRTEYMTYDGGRTWTTRCFAEFHDGSEEMLSAGPIDAYWAKRGWNSAIAIGWKPADTNPPGTPPFLN